MRLASRVNRLEGKLGTKQGQHTRYAAIVADPRCPRAQLDQFIAEHGIDGPNYVRFVILYEPTNDADPIIEPYVRWATPPV